MLLGLKTFELISAAALALAMIGFALVVFLTMRISRYRKAQLVLLSKDGHGKQDIVEVVNQYITEVKALGQSVGDLRAEIADVRTNLKKAVQHFNVVRHDAFEDVGGRQSFSAAILDDFGDGIVLSSIHGRSENRVYAKPIKNGESLYRLSDEETEAIKGAKRQTQLEAE